MHDSLALRYRPRKFSDLVGQKSVQVFLRQMVLKERVPTALLFEGSSGTGKTSAARILGAALNCSLQSEPPCGECTSCVEVFEGSSLDVHEIDAASNGLIEDVRALQDSLLYVTPGRKRVVILDEAHGLSRAASNALLKTLEEPPADTVFILLSTDASKLLSTIAGRCMSFTFRRVSTSDILARLQEICEQEHLNTEAALLRTISQRSQGSVRNAIMTLDQAVSSGMNTYEEFVEAVQDPDNGIHILQAMLTDDYSKIFNSLDKAVAGSGNLGNVGSELTAAVRDLLVLHSGGELEVQGEALLIRQELAKHISAATAVALIRLLWDLKTKVRVAESTRAHLDLTVTMMTETLFQRLGPPSGPLAPLKPRPMTFDEMSSKL